MVERMTTLPVGGFRIHNVNFRNGRTVDHMNTTILWGSLKFAPITRNISTTNFFSCWLHSWDCTMKCSIEEGWTALNGGLGWCSCLTLFFCELSSSFQSCVILHQGARHYSIHGVHLLRWLLGRQFILFSRVGLLSSSSSLFTKRLQRHLLHLRPGARSRVIYRLFKF